MSVKWDTFPPLSSLCGRPSSMAPCANRKKALSRLILLSSFVWMLNSLRQPSTTPWWAWWVPPWAATTCNTVTMQQHRYVLITLYKWHGYDLLDDWMQKWLIIHTCPLTNKICKNRGRRWGGLPRSKPICHCSAKWKYEYYRCILMSKHNSTQWFMLKIALAMVLKEIGVSLCPSMGCSQNY